MATNRNRAVTVLRYQICVRDPLTELLSNKLLEATKNLDCCIKPKLLFGLKSFSFVAVPQIMLFNFIIMSTHHTTETF